MHLPFTDIRKVAFVGTYLPRRCGIATFTYDLCTAVTRAFPQLPAMVVPMNDRPRGYEYLDPVRFEVDDQSIDAYRRAADFLNIADVDVVCLQHEYGIFGGIAGTHILHLLRRLRMPVVTTFHTILREPDPLQARSLREIAARSARVVTMSERGRQFLRDIHGVADTRIDVIPHGIHDVPFVDPGYHKDRFGVEGQSVLMTFGLLSPGKGIEQAIEALPAIVASHPRVTYLIAGATHPHVQAQSGEGYRMSLQSLAERLGVAGNVRFINRFLDHGELMELIGATDIYMTPYLNPRQITSGTLAYAVGAGKAVVSTPYWHAEELLSDGRGILVPFKDPTAMAAAVNGLLANDAERSAMRKRAYLHGRNMVWAQVADLYMQSWRQARAQRIQPSEPAETPEQTAVELPEIRLEHLQLMTDGVGMVQHAVYDVPDYRHGYSIDDNARALILTCYLHEESQELREPAWRLARRYMAFLHYAWNPDTRRFRNFLGFDRRWMEAQGSDDSHARTLWALGVAIGRGSELGLSPLAGQLFEQGIRVSSGFLHPRSWAFALIGVHEYLKRFNGDRALRDMRTSLGDQLMTLYGKHRQDHWRWFEDDLSYANAKLPHALLVAGHGTGRADWMDAALEALRWLAGVQRGESGCFDPIGNGFWKRGGPRSRFDQQPIEAHAMCSACLEAWTITGDTYWRDEATRAFDWFLGRNALGLPLYVATTGACCDGLQPDRLNRNQGAESTLAFLLSLLEMRAASRQDQSPPPLTANAAS